MKSVVPPLRPRDNGRSASVQLVAPMLPIYRQDFSPFSIFTYFFLSFFFPPFLWFFIPRAIARERHFLPKTSAAAGLRQFPQDAPRTQR
jgi:hypothetical protein